MNFRRLSQRGAISLQSLIFLVIMGTGIYAGIKMVVPLIRFYQVQELFKVEVVRLKMVSDEDVIKEIKFKLAEIEVPISDDDWRIIREEGKAPRIEGTYVVDVDFAGVYKYRYTFNPVGVPPKSAGYN